MQGVGGSKGSNDQSLTDLASAAETAFELAQGTAASIFEDYAKAGLVDQVSRFLGRLSTDFSSGANVNFQNNIRKDDSSATPLMWVYEAVSSPPSTCVSCRTY